MLEVAASYHHDLLHVLAPLVHPIGLAHLDLIELEVSDVGRQPGEALPAGPPQSNQEGVPSLHLEDPDDLEQVVQGEFKEDEVQGLLRPDVLVL